MKKIAFSIVLITMVSLALFAEGSQEETTWEPGSGYMGRGYTNTGQTNWGRGQMPMRGGNMGFPGRGYTNPEFEIESLTLTGEIDLSDVDVPKLTVGENTYELMVPYRLDYDIDIKDGDEITINGFEVSAYRRASDSETANLMVTGAIFNGIEYDLGTMNYGPMSYGTGPGRFNNSVFHNNLNNRGPQTGRRGNTPAGRYCW